MKISNSIYFKNYTPNKKDSTTTGNVTRPLSQSFCANNQISSQYSDTSHHSLSRDSSAQFLAQQLKILQTNLPSFKANQKAHKKNFDEQAAKAKLLRQMNDIIEANRDIDELYAIHERNISNIKHQTLNRIKNLMIEFEMTRMSPLLSQQQMYERLRSIEKELNTLEKSLQTIKEFVPPPTQDNKLQDVALVNKLKVALLEDNFNFDKVYHNHYKHLNDIKFVDALALWYPKIKVPAHPKEVIAKKIESCLTRDFYEELHEKMQTNTSKEIEKFCSNKIREIFLQNPNSDQATLYKVQENTVLYILGKYRNIVENDTFSQLPLHRKTKIPQITDIDKKLLNIDYNKFVLHVIKEQYLNNKKPNEIKYTDNGITINVAQLSSTPYRYEKTSEKIKTLISSANEIKKARRNYDNFTEEELRARLNYFVSKEIGNNEKILEKIIDFDTCDLSTQDKDSLIKFFRVLDTVLDENATVEDALKRIKAEDIRPKEKDRKQKIERQKIAELLKKEQQKAYELNELKTRFDEAVNYLYMNGLNNCATVSANYRPNNLSNESKENANFVINTINKNIAPDGTFNKSNSSKINSEILAFDAYNYYSKNEPKEEIFDAATKYATQNDGSVDVIKAGKYLNNAAIITNAPESLKYIKDKEIVEGILEKEPEQDKQIRYLCKYEDYKILTTEEKTHLSEFKQIFDLRNSVEKFILKNIIENDYINKDTNVLLKINDESDTIKATLTANAKHQILEKYKFPTCLTYLEGFEEGLKSFASEWGTSGIKKTGTNNKSLDYKLEIKLSGHDDRVFSKEMDYYFDIFSDKGLH